MREEEDTSGDSSQASDTASQGTKFPPTRQQWGRTQASWQGVPRFTAPPPPEPKKITPKETVSTQEQLGLGRHQRSQSINSQPEPTSPHFQSAARSTTLDQYIGAARKDQPRHIQLWKCGCGFSNRQIDHECRSCRAPSPEIQRQSNNPDFAQSWRHVRRVGDSDAPGAPKQATTRNEIVIDKALEEARRKRMEEGKQRRFVGLESQFRKVQLDFREVPKKQATSESSENQPPLRFHDVGTKLGNGNLDSSRQSAPVTPSYKSESSRAGESTSPVRRTMSESGISTNQADKGGWKKWTPPPTAPSTETRRREPSVKDSYPTAPRGRQTGVNDVRDEPEERQRSFRIRRPDQPDRSREDDEPQSTQPQAIPTGSTGSFTPPYDGSKEEQAASSTPKSSNTVVRKAWHKADLANLFPDKTQKDSPSSHEHKRSPGYDAEYISMMEEQTQDSPSGEVAQYGPTEEMKASERQAAERRMARRLQELEEDSKSSKRKPAQTRFDPHRERRTSIARTRKSLATMEDDFDPEDESASLRQHRKRERKKQQAAEKLQGPPTPIYLPEFISVANLAGALRIRIEEFARKMRDLGFEETNNDHVLDAETAGLIAAEFNFEPIVDQAEEQDLVPRPPAEDKSLLPPRPPVVTIMGHVDHGKTTLLDWLRKSSVAASEYGGITQHIGAFSVPMPSGKTITFLDTPGHAAFLDMRQRGANVTDIVILVVAADDSVKPQTVEAIKHAHAARVPMIVAVNKIDKEDSNVDKVKQDLARYGVEIEDYGGDTQVVCVSGKTGQGMETLEESAVALADILDMRAEIDGQAEGWVLEATTKKAGRVATVLVRRGTLYPGDIIVAGSTWARVRSLRNEAGVQVASAGPGTPVEIDGWKDQPGAGDEVLQANDEQHARSVVDIRLQAAERVQMATDMSAVNETRRLDQERREVAEAAETAAAEGIEAAPTEKKEIVSGFKDVPLLVKADVSGSVEAVLASVLALGNTSVRASILRSGVGTVSEFDVSHAASAQGHIVAFNIPIEPHIRRAAEVSGVKILEQNVIYRLVDLVKGVLEDYLEPIKTKRVLGEAEVAQVFEINVKGRQVVPVAGCKVRNGVVARNARVVVKRGGEEVFDGEFQILLSALF